MTDPVAKGQEPGTGVVARLDERNRAAEVIIARYAKDHAVADGASGTLGGLIPIPGAGIAVVMGQLLHQSKRLYPALATDLSAIYATSPDALQPLLEGVHGDEKRFRRTVGGVMSSMDEVAQLALTLHGEFSSKFLQDVALDLAGENAPGLIGGSIPLFGALIGGSLDALIAVTMTWRVGAMMSIHAQNDGFVGTRKQTWDLVRRGLVKRSLDIFRPDLLTRIRENIPEVHTTLIRHAREALVEMQRSGLTREAAIAALSQTSGAGSSWRIPKDLLARV